LRYKNIYFPSQLESPIARGNVKGNRFYPDVSGCGIRLADARGKEAVAPPPPPEVEVAE